MPALGISFVSMGRVRDFLKQFVVDRQRKPASNVEELRGDFKARYHKFRLILSANNKSLEVMVAIEQALQGRLSFATSFIRTNCTAISVNVFRMINNLMALAPGKYKGLIDRFNEIEEQINRLLVEKEPVKDERLVISLHSVHSDMSDMVGNKMANLAEIRNALQLKVPNGFIITAYAYQKFFEQNNLGAEIERLFQTSDVNDMEKLCELSADIYRLIVTSDVPDVIVKAVEEAYAQLETEEGKGVRVAMRSSAQAEDLAGISFAGQYHSVLNVTPENIIHAFKEVVAGKYSLPAITYRLDRGYKDEDVAMCVGCLTMINAKAGGVAYSRNPTNLSDDSIFINSAWGLSKPVCDGSVNSDLFKVSSKKPLRVVYEKLNVKNQKFVCLPQGGVCHTDLTGDVGQLPSLNHEQACALAAMALKLEDYYQCPQDVEWAIAEDGTLNILQSRPLQQMEKVQRDFPDIPENDDDTVVARGGIAASPGAAAGPVFLVKKEVDFLQFPQGAILVTRQALPRWAPLLGRAVAVVTEQGGIAGHLANVSREFGVPALFGVDGIVEKLKNGDIITVDAVGLAIFEGRKDSLLTTSRVSEEKRKEDSPIFETLQEISQYVVPLYLLDPDSTEFSPENCKTFHDITRFIHEKSVLEMFEFGKDHNFSERSSKQLVCRVPMKWWILNLDDGFKEEVEGKRVRLENIASAPMLALWHGITAIPWEGPPPIDGKGLMAVMFQSTTDPALTLGVKSKYSEKNYFMISKNFCSLTSRIGFHFSTIEALVSGRAAENYIRFFFKGGAADYQRRMKRVVFLGEILEENGFKTDVKEDYLAARINNLERDLMIRQLQVLGYLTTHTRQLDMIMSNNATVKYYRSKMKTDIQKIIDSHEKNLHQIERNVLLEKL